jgi:hypothetical protein
VPNARTPRLSVIVLTDDFATIRHLVEHLTAQTIAGDVELVVVCQSAKELAFPADAADALARVTVVECSLLPLGRARAAAVQAASAPLIALGETHAFPSPMWAEQLISAHDGPYLAVAPGMVNANPKTARSWSGFLMDYGRWMAVRTVADVEPPAYNACWKRDVLLALRERMPLMLEPGGPLDPEFVGHSASFRHAPNAKVAHVNVARQGAWAAERYWGGRLFGARRCRDWPFARRLVYFGGSALVPFVRFVRTQDAIAHARKDRDLPRWTAAAVASGCLLWALGEAVGYIAGEGRSEARMLEYELHKERYT